MFKLKICDGSFVGSQVDEGVKSSIISLFLYTLLQSLSFQEMNCSPLIWLTLKLDLILAIFYADSYNRMVKIAINIIWTHLKNVGGQFIAKSIDTHKSPKHLNVYKKTFYIFVNTN